MCEELNPSLLDDYPEGTALIRFIHNGRMHDWYISASEKDDKASLEWHLKTWAPDAEMRGWVFKR